MKIGDNLYIHLTMSHALCLRFPQNTLISTANCLLWYTKICVWLYIYV